MSRVRATLAGPSLLLRHLNHSLDALRNLYRPAYSISTSGSRREMLPSESLQPSRFPPTPSSFSEGDAVVRFFCDELNMGYEGLSRWRHELRQRQHIAADWGRVTLPRRTTHKTGVTLSSFVPRAQDVRLVQSAVTDLHATISPFLTLSPPPNTETQTQKEVIHNGAYSPPETRPTSAHDTSTFYAIRNIPAGMFLLSVPTEAVFFAQPPPSSEPLLTYFLYVDDLIGQLIACVMDEESTNSTTTMKENKSNSEKSSAPASHATYVRYLMDSIVPCRNLPFLTKEELMALLGVDVAQVPREASIATTSDEGTLDTVRKNSDIAVKSKEAENERLSSPALDLWSFFHETMQGSPLSPYLRDHVSNAEYAWWVSAVLSRRAGAATLIPLLDKLNHSAEPNCYYTMSTTETMCGLDVLDNMMAGVEAEALYEPHVHVFAIRDIAAGEPLTVCYASANASHYHYSKNNSSSKKAQEESDTGNEEEEVSASSLLSILHSSSSVTASSRAGRIAEVETGEGKAMWQLQWGFVPQRDAVYSASDLREVAALVAERRVDTRALLFPVKATS